MKTQHEIRLEARTRLSELYTPEEINVWMDSPQILLGDESATSLIEQGRGDEVLALVGNIVDMVYL